MHNLARIFDEAASPADYTDKYFARLTQVLAELDRQVIQAVVEALQAAFAKGNTLYLMANGGSAAAASHLVNDLVAGGFMEGQPPMRAVCLSDNTETVTALANDAGYENVFVRQLQVHLKPGDVVLAMSVSGSSENVIRAVDYANKNGAVTIGFCGFEGGPLSKKAKIALHAVTTKDEYGPVEDVFAIMVHIIGTYLTMARGKRLHH